MCNPCQQEIHAFRNRQTPVRPWKYLDRQLVADRLQETLFDPDTLMPGASVFVGSLRFYGYGCSTTTWR